MPGQSRCPPAHSDRRRRLLKESSSDGCPLCAVYEEPDRFGRCVRALGSVKEPPLRSPDHAWPTPSISPVSAISSPAAFSRTDRVQPSLPSFLARLRDAEFQAAQCGAGNYAVGVGGRPFVPRSGHSGSRRRSETAHHIRDFCRPRASLLRSASFAPRLIERSVAEPNHSRILASVSSRGTPASVSS